MSTGTNRERLEQNNTLLEDIKTQIQNLPEVGSSGGIKQFSTVEEMQADTTAQEGDLAIVYRSEVQNATVDSKFQVATFPDTVVLDTAITNYVDVRYRAVDSSKMFDCMGSLDSSGFSMDCYTDSGSVRIQYTSSDGITYTRTDSTGNPVDFGTEIYYEMTEYWNDAIGKFIQVNKNTFEGLYEYTNYKDTNNIKLVPLSSINIDETTGRLVWDGKTFIDKEIPINKISQIKQLFLDNSILTTSTEYFFLFLDNNDKLCTAISTAGSSYANSMVIANYDSNTKKINEILGFTQNSYSTSSYGETNIYEIDIDNMTYTLRDTISEVSYTSDSNTRYYRTYSNIKSLLISTADIGVFIDNLYIKNLTNSARRITNESGGYYSDSDLYSIKSTYTAAPTQLSATSDYVYGKEFYGKNGVEVGTLQNKESLTKDGVKRRVDMWSSYNSGIVCPNDVSNIFNGYTNLTTIPLLDTSKVTNMGYMFYNCTNLTTIPLLDTSNATNMYSMFQICTSLSDESLNNILAMCTNATSYTSVKTLAYLGLTSAQANKCKTLSNYQAFLNAGWTTGY